MRKMPAARAESTQAFLKLAAANLAELCTACGACFEICPMVDRLGLRGSDPHATTDGLRNLARGIAGPSNTVAWVGGCAKSGLCVDTCPERDKGLDAMLLVRLAKQRAINDTRQIAIIHDPTYFPRLKTFARMQLSDSL
jgi:Fe-S oxidoreductase